MKKFIFISYLLLHCVAAPATPVAVSQDHALIQNVAAAFIEQQTAALPGKVTYTVNEIDQRITLPACAKLEAFLPAGSPFVGKTSIGVRCMEKKGWSIFVPAQIKLSINLLVSARQLPVGHILQVQDFTSQTTEAFQTDGLTDPKQAIGKVLRYSITSGQILREDMLRQPFAVTQGQIVPIIVQNDSFNIRSEGAALGNASEGQTVQVRIGSGRVIGGIARENGIVEIGP